MDAEERKFIIYPIILIKSGLEKLEDRRIKFQILEL